LKRRSLVGASVLIALAALRLWWGFEAQRRVNAFVAAAHARGERVVAADFCGRGAAG
jgi:hypothetical protein